MESASSATSLVPLPQEGKENHSTNMINSEMKLRSPPKRPSSTRWKKRRREERYYDRIEQSPVMTALEAAAEEKSLFSANIADDLFLHIMGFFVSKTNGVVDGDTVESMSQVSKHWYGLVNAPSLWPAQHDCQVRDACSSTGVSSALIGFRKIERVLSLWSDGVPVYRVVERATKQVYVVRIVSAVDHKLLTHVACTHQLLGDEHLWNNAPPELADSMVFPLRVEHCGNVAVLWYDNCEQSLEYWFKTNDRCANPYLSDSEPPKSLPYTLEHLKGWFRNLLKALRLLETLGFIQDRSDTMYWISSKSVFLDRDSSRLRLLVPSIGIESSPSAGRVSTGSADIFFVAFLFFKIVKCGKHWDMMSDVSLCDKAEKLKWLKREAPSLDDSGLDFFFHIFREAREDRLTVREALLHPFLSLEDSDESPRRNLTAERRMIPRSLANEIQLQPDRRHARPHEWATLVDWLFEICLTFNLYINDAYRAMHYFDEALSSASLTIPRSNYQLLAGTCLLISTKLTGTTAIGPADIAFSADNSFEKEEVLETEQFVLEQLGWRLARPTIWDFANTHFAMDVEACRVVNYMSEWGQQSQLYLTYPPSVSGAAVVVVALYCIDRRPLWPAEAQERSGGLSLADLEAPVSALLTDIHHIRSTMPDLKMIERGSNGLELRRPIPTSLDLLLMQQVMR